MVSGRQVGARLVITTSEPVDLVLQIAVADMEPAVLSETWQVSNGRGPITLTELALTGEGRLHLARLDAGRLTVTYDAELIGLADPMPTTDMDRIKYLRPSRYAESDRLSAVARSEFAGIAGAHDLLAAVSSWVGSRVSYVPGSSAPTHGAVDTFLLGQGVCRDYAHLVIALLRALDVPARLAAVYAPGLNPMDFHAVAEALIGGQWFVVDATLLAPREGLVRIATGRDAADTAFLSTYGSVVSLDELQVYAVIDGDLPTEDVTSLMHIR